MIMHIPGVDRLLETDWINIQNNKYANSCFIYYFLVKAYKTKVKQNKKLPRISTSYFVQLLLNKPENLNLKFELLFIV